MQFVECLAEFENNQAGEMFGNGDTGWIRLLVIQFFQVIEEILPLGAIAAGAGPFLVAAMSPDGEVLVGNFSSAELFNHDLLDVGLGIEPGEEVSADGALGEAMIEF